MASITHIINVCDLCGSEEDVRTRTVRIDRRTAELEVCPGCWVPFRDMADKFINAGRRIDVPTRAKKTASKKAQVAASNTSAEKPRSTRPATKAAAKKTAAKPSSGKASTRKSTAKKVAAKVS